MSALSAVSQLGFGRDVFSEEHDTFRRTVRRFFQKEIEPNTRQWEKDGFYPAELFRKAGRAGLLCASVPSEYGGGSGDGLHHTILHEEHGYSIAGPSLEAGLTTDATSLIVFNDGTEEQKREWLPQLASGEAIGEVGLSEPGAGSDLRNIKTFARRDGDDFILNGQKAWISNGPLLTVMFVIAKTKVEDREGMTMFILPADSKGVSRTRPTDLMLKSCGGVCEFFFEDVRLPSRAIVGGLGNGLRTAVGELARGRASIAGRSIAACELAIEITKDFVKNRRAFGQTIFDFQNTKFKLASVATEISAGRAFVDTALRQLQDRKLSPVESAKLKLFCTEVEGRVMDECLQLHGGAGFSNEYTISKLYAHARAHRIYAGTSEIMRQTIGASL